eukprot:11206052-Lingulodinium_polyedra.AAC.1
MRPAARPPDRHLGAAALCLLDCDRREPLVGLGATGLPGRSTAPRAPSNGPYLAREAQGAVENAAWPGA